MLSAEDIERRVPVWCAMTELFLDTELQPSDLDYIAATLRASGYTLAELREILRREVTPVFGPNLLSVAGEWAGWDEREVRRIMLTRLRRAPSPVSWVLGRTLARMIKAEWLEIERRLDWIPVPGGEGRAG